MKKKIRNLILSSLLSFISMSSVMNVSAAGSNDFIDERKRAFFSRIGVNLEDERKLLGVDVQFHSDEYWKEDITQLWLDCIETLAPNERGNYNPFCSFRAHYSYSREQYDLFKEKFNRIFGIDFCFPDEIFMRVLREVNHMFVYNIENREARERRDKQRYRLFGTQPLTRANLLAIMVIRCFGCRGTYGLSDPLMAHEAGQLFLPCYHLKLFLDDFIKFKVVEKEMEFRKKGVNESYDCALTFMNLIFRYISLADNIVRDYAQSVSGGDRGIFWELNKRGTLFGELQHRCKLLLESDSLSEFFDRLENFINYANIECGVDIKNFIRQ